MSTTDSAPKAAFGSYLLAFAALLLLWILLVGSLEPTELSAGLLVALVVTVVSGPRLAILNGVRLEPAALVHLVRYLGYFLVALVQSNIDMARRVLSPSLPLRPAVVEVATSLESALGRLVLANSITLTPGTLSVDVKGDRVLVHWVDCAPGTDLEAATRTIAAGFERHISGFLK
jgi:multicomponent Na+:H+ antiporter subunit E